MNHFRLFGLFLVLSFSSTVYSEPPAQDESALVLEKLSQKKAHTASLLSSLASCKTHEERLAALEKITSPAEILSNYPGLKAFYKKAPVQQKMALASLIAIDQFPALFSGFENLSNKDEKVGELLRSLSEVDSFYESIGGIIGYQDTILQLFLTKDTPPDPSKFALPPYTDIRQNNEEVWKLVYEGVKQLPQMAEILVVGGAGERLNLIDEKTKEPLPAACLLFDGKTLFEGLMRDIEALEYLHYRAFGKRISLPTLIMTSYVKDNNQHIAEMGQKARWYGRNPEYIRSMIQDQVPVVSLDGNWVVTSPLTLDMKPGGHGIVWRLAQTSGGFSWLRNFGANAVVVRQVNNPFVGLDTSLAAFMGYGLSHNKAFGFASIPSRPGLSEGLNILSFKKDATAAISNIEYTHFTTLKNLRPDLFKEGACPANTNTLFANILAVEKAIQRNPFPGTLINVKVTPDALKNASAKKIGARLECSMQNIADSLSSSFGSNNAPDKKALATFLLLQEREKFMSVAKKAFAPNQSALETPESCFYDWTKAMRRILKDHCSFTLPAEQTLEEYLKEGPSMTFSFNPCLGPLWEIIGQKIQGGSLAPRSDLTLDLAEIYCRNLDLEGSFSIKANAPTGPFFHERGRVFNDRVGRAHLENIVVRNKGYGSRTASEALKRSTQPKEQLHIVLEGLSEVVAKDIAINGPLYLFVPDGQRATLLTTPSGEIDVKFELISSPSWVYDFSWKPGLPPELIKKDFSTQPK